MIDAGGAVRRGGPGLGGAGSRPGLVRSCIAALAAVALAAGLRQLLDAYLGDRYPFVLFLAASLLCSWRLGWKAGALSLALGLLAADLLFVQPRGTLAWPPAQVLTGMAVTLAVGALCVCLIETLRAACHHSDEQARRLTEEMQERKLAEEALRRAKDELEWQVGQRSAELRAAAAHATQGSAALRDAEAKAQRLAALVASSEDGIVATDLDGVITNWNAAAERLFGYSTAEAVGQSILLLVPAEQHDAAERTVRRLGEGEQVPPYEAARLRKDGTSVAVSVRPSLVVHQGRVIGFSLIYHDLTHARRLEEQLRQTQKMEAIGRLAGGVAHDFNNLLTVINGYGELLLGALGAGESSRAYAQEIGRAGERAAALTRQLLAFSRQQVLEVKVVDLNESVRASEQLLRRLIGEDVRLETALAPDLDRVRADPGQMGQVIMNLALNARDAMPTGGRLTIETANVRLDEAYARGRPEVVPGRYVLLAVSDTGCGMTEQTLARVFEPFFTTKEVGKGTGLGLAVVHGVVSQSGGHVAASSEPGRGTAFKVYLPAVGAARPAGKSHQGLQPAPRGSETVLLVEDDESVRNLARIVLRASGYFVLEARHGGEAVRLAQEYAGPIHLVVSDVVMPEVGGRLLAERLAALRPDVKVLFVSGYTDDAVVRHGVLEAEVAFLQKPFSPAALAAKVREVLDQ
jgi:two-component system cell cycle sensor histidine kinase/response regulator CckA